MYAVAGLIVVVLEALIVLRWRANPDTSIFVASLIVEPFFIAIISAFTYADIRGDFSPSATWSRILERSWAVLLIDLLTTLIAAIGLQSLFTADLFQKLLGSVVLVVSISFIFADVAAVVVDDAEPWWLLVPRSLGASMVVAWQGATFARAIIVFALSDLLPLTIDEAIQSALAANHTPHAPLWANAITLVLLLPIVQALCTYVYLDAIRYEPKRS
ncbi:MAG: hypothetical protein ABR949_02325 [Candidatus Aquilonibacter sp.]